MSPPNTTPGFVGGALIKTGGGTLILSNANTAFRGALYIDSASSAGNNGVVRVVNHQALARGAVHLHPQP